MAYVRGWVFFDTTSECAYVFQNVLIEIWSTSIKFFATVRRVLSFDSNDSGAVRIIQRKNR